MKDLDPCEADFFGDLARDTHGLWEMFAFVRHHFCAFSDEEVLNRGISYLKQWRDNGWIRLAVKPLYESKVRDLEGVIDFATIRGADALRYCDGSPSLDITSEGYGALMSKAAEPGATDNPDDAQRLREDH